VFFETSAVVLTVILLGRYLESIAKGKAAAALSELARMQVDTAMLVTSTVGAKETEKKEEDALTSNTELIRTELLQRDDIVQVLPGTRVPTDGVIVFGSSFVDEAMLTGEARPVNKSVGDIVYGSTVNQRGMVHLRVTRVPGENALSGIMQLVRQAQSSTPPIQRVADAVAAYFVPAILALAVSIFILWILLVEYGVVTTDLAAVTFAIKFAIATLVVSCPCAVGLAVPVPVVVASGVGAKLGVLFKSGPALEALHKADVIVFDKTGTLTLGQPTVVQWRNVSPSGLSDRLLWWTVASAESGSEHVWAKAMLEYARSNLVDGGALAALGTPSAFEAVSGRGIRCSLNDEAVLIGNARWMEENGVSIVADAAPLAAPSRVSCGEVECGQSNADCCPPYLEPPAVCDASAANEEVARLEQSGASVVYVAIGQGLAGWIALSDAVRPEAGAVVKALEQLKVQVWILSGDAQTSTDAVAKQLGLDPKRACGQLLPGDKARRVQELQQSGHIVAMVGDGINDAPALTQADIGLTVMNGSDVAMGAADVVLMKDHLSLLLHALELSRATFSVIKLNLGWSFFYNLCAIPFAVGAFYTLNGIVLPPTFAGLAELLSSLPVILFAIALKWFKPKSHIEPM
jgi:Cu+-exporting ATPase